MTVDPDISWDTWTVRVVGGEPQLLLKNGSGLEWCGRRQILFSEIKRGTHMGVVAGDDSRVGARDVYLPADDAGMAHRSYPSPDGKWVLLVEMDGDHLWEPCRVVPSDGSSPGRQVGPLGGGCTFGAWSPDGRWIYLTSNAVGTNHIWRQRFPDGRFRGARPYPIGRGLFDDQGAELGLTACIHFSLRRDYTSPTHLDSQELRPGSVQHPCRVADRTSENETVPLAPLRETRAGCSQLSPLVSRERAASNSSLNSSAPGRSPARRSRPLVPPGLIAVGAGAFAAL